MSCGENFVKRRDVRLVGGSGGDEEGGAGGPDLRVHVAAAAAIAALAGAAAAAASSAARHLRGCLGLDGGLDWCWLLLCFLLASLSNNGRQRELFIGE